MAQNNTLDYMQLMRKMTDVVAHDIRNPLNNILLSTAQFKLDMPPDKEDTAFYIDIIERNCDRINSTIADIVSVIHQQGLMPAIFDITELLKELLEEKEERFALLKVQCIAPLKEVVVAPFDRQQMKPALDHLLENALDAMPGGGTLRVSAGAQTGEVKIEIQDSGEGIRDEVLPHIFAPFFTTRDRHRGLGLTQVRSVTEAHQGRVAVTTDATGSCFSLFLPLER